MINALSQHIGRDIARLIYFKYLDRVDHWVCLTASKLPYTFFYTILYKIGLYKPIEFPTNLLSNVISSHNITVIKWLLDNNYREQYVVDYKIDDSTIISNRYAINNPLNRYKVQWTTGNFYFSKNK